MIRLFMNHAESTVWRPVSIAYAADLCSRQYGGHSPLDSAKRQEIQLRALAVTYPGVEFTDCTRKDFKISCGDYQIMKFDTDRIPADYEVEMWATEDPS